MKLLVLLAAGRKSFLAIALGLSRIHLRKAKASLIVDLRKLHYRNFINIKMYNLKLFSFLFSLNYTLLSCTTFNCDRLTLDNLGVIQFRRSYADHLSLAGLQLDSIIKSNPKFDLTFNDAKPELHKYLDKLGFSNQTGLLINKVDTLLNETIFIHQSSEETYSVSTNLDLKTEKTYLIIAGKNCRDSFYLDQSLSRPRIRVVELNPEKKKFIAVYWQYYFINGDMFDLALFEIK